MQASVVDSKTELLVSIVSVYVGIGRDGHVDGHLGLDDGEACLCHFVVVFVEEGNLVVAGDKELVVIVGQGEGVVAVVHLGAYGWFVVFYA